MYRCRCCYYCCHCCADLYAIVDAAGARSHSGGRHPRGGVLHHLVDDGGGDASGELPRGAVHGLKQLLRALKEERVGVVVG